jgi:hypothetical protein
MVQGCSEPLLEEKKGGRGRTVLSARIARPWRRRSDRADAKAQWHSGGACGAGREDRGKKGRAGTPMKITPAAGSKGTTTIDRPQLGQLSSQVGESFPGLGPGPGCGLGRGTHSTSRPRAKFRSRPSCPIGLWSELCGALQAAR